MWYDLVFQCTIWMRPEWEKSVLPEELAVESFTEWFRDAEPRIRHALTATFGFQVGMDVAADALSHAWEHWDLVRAKPNPMAMCMGLAATRGDGWLAVVHPCSQMCRHSAFRMSNRDCRQRLLRYPRSSESS